MTATLERPVAKETELAPAEVALERMMALPSLERIRGSATLLSSEAKNLLLDILTDELGACLPSVQELPQRSRDQWQRLCRHGWRGRAQEIHDARAMFENTIETRLAIALRAVHLAEFFTLLSGQELREQAEFQRVTRELEEFKEQVFASWKSLEDLEDLLAQTFPLSHRDLEAIGNKHFPPDEWFLTEEEKPF